MVGVETLNPHECRGTLRKSQKMRRTGWCALLRIMDIKNRLKRNSNEIVDINFALCEMRAASIARGRNEILYSGLSLLS